MNPFAALLAPAPRKEENLPSNDFAQLSADIAYDVLHSTDIDNDMREVEGQWGDIAEVKKASNANWNFDQVHKFKYIPLPLEDLHGRLRLDFTKTAWFNADFGRECLEKMQPRFSEISIEVRRSSPKNLLEVPDHVKKFILRQLKSRHLVDFRCNISENLNIDGDILKLCTSDNCHRFEWHGNVSLRVVQSLFTHLKTRNLGPNLITRKFCLKIDRSNIPTIAEILRLQPIRGQMQHFKRLFNDRNPEMAVEIYVLRTGVIYIFLRKQDDHKMLWALREGLKRLQIQMEEVPDDEKDPSKPLETFDAALQRTLDGAAVCDDEEDGVGGDEDETSDEEEDVNM
ncbi:hypothetical protein QR680_012214 [Steinernema hermaphroditum]|uniref:Uncharacterized protein n=1 Tax=Steinernema hermaphroditum TaxID=289476 RepID=A0AA39M057_9BILA|nr:hypothetical protein QR680_012214 [Steinernema hermaphroditum]